MLQEVPLPIAGALVRVRGERWRVTEVVNYEDCALCFLSSAPSSNRPTRLALLLPFDRPQPLETPRRPARAGRREWVSALRERLLAGARWTELRSAAPARIDLLPYQLEPALAILGGETRVLIADEVGLGKTVEAGIVLAELFARDHSTRALVLAPASLCGQWVSELRERFNLPARHLDAESVRRVADCAPPGISPWRQVSLPVASFDFLKQPEVMVGLSAMQFDALVVDEAHMAALAPERSRLAQAVARRARRVVLLTATPHAADREGFRALCGVGRMQGEPPILAFRRTRSGLGLAPSRRVVILRLRLSHPEREMHAALARYTARVWREAGTVGDRADARLAMIVLRKRASSGVAPLEASLARRLRYLAASPSPPPASQLLLPLDASDEDREDEQPLGVLAAPGLEDADAERGELSHLLDLARAALPADSKVRALERLLFRVREPAIVFTEYRDTLARLAERLQGAGPITLLHGGMDQAARREAIGAFTHGQSRLLLATDAAAHGLNLHARCRLVINVELPWMPARLEQRIGRVDRIGQRRKVHAVHLVAGGTFEEEVLSLLVRRIERERCALGYADNPLGATGEAEVAALIFGAASGPVARSCRRLEDAGGPASLPVGEASPPIEDAVGPASLPVEGDTQPALVKGDGDASGAADESPVRRARFERLAAEEVTRLRWMRALLGGSTGRHCRGAPAPVAVRRGSRGSAGRPLWTVLRARKRLAALPAGLVCVYAARVVDGRGRLLEECVWPLHVALSQQLRGRRDLAAQLPSLIAAARERLEGAARQLASGRVAELRAALPSHLASLLARESVMGRDQQQAISPVQAGLFDRRALKALEEEHRRRAADAAEAAARSDALDGCSEVELAGDPELVLVLGLAR